MQLEDPIKLLISSLIFQPSKMQSSALACFSPPSTPFLVPFKNSNTNPIFGLTLCSHSLKPLDLGLIYRVSSSCQNTSRFGSSSRLNRRISPSFLCLNQRFDNLKVRAASVPDNVDDVTRKSSSLLHILQLVGLFGLWYILNIYFNIFNKQVLKVYPYPTTVSAFQFGCGTVMIILTWTFNLYPRPKLSRSQLAAILPLAVAHTLGNLLTNVSLGMVNVSFTQTIKAMEPFFTVLLAALFLSERPTLWVVSSLVPIVGGVALASLTEVSFNWTGFISAMASNVTNQSRNVLSKKFMARKEDTLDNINLFSVITIISFILLVPAAIFIEGLKFTPRHLQSVASQGLNIRELCVRSLIAGFCFHAYQQVSYMILQKLSWNRSGSCWSLLVFKSKADQAKAKHSLMSWCLAQFSLTTRALIDCSSVLHDTTKGITCDPLFRKVCEACGGDCLLSHILPNTEPQWHLLESSCIQEQIKADQAKAIDNLSQSVLVIL
ncbi:hypothetical protein LWI28_021345 [Acer negundo]|uniref:Sugar phosphate transporter domain-containing protein n=1 Tax=Acer negundo TaxID=4023 RepID=A0AAD5IV95_ACENE|nr:hypothetical protein LWI28_021345 [Acer negundo]